MLIINIFNLSQHYIKNILPTFTKQPTPLRAIFVLLVLLAALMAQGQNTIGLPDVINYRKQAYRAGLQNWEIRQDYKGVIYVANNEGLLSFDGTAWQLFPLPNRTIVRSVEIGKDNRIYVGGQGELGYFSPDPAGVLRFHSILQKIPPTDQSFGDVWDITSSAQGVFFRCSNVIFRLENDTISRYPAPSEWGFMGVANEKVYAQDFNKGLLVFEQDSWVSLSSSNSLPTNDPVTGILPAGADSAIITTLKNGLFRLSGHSIKPFPSPNQSTFTKERIYAAATINKDRIALASNNSGVYIIDLRGNILQQFSRREGLQHNNVLSIFSDNRQNLWLGLDNGIDLITYNSAIKQIAPGLQDASGYTIAIHKNHLYVGTSGGLYSVLLNREAADISFTLGDFKPVNNTTGQTWGLSTIGEHLLLGHHEGGYDVNDNKVNVITKQQGIWNFVHVSDSNGINRVAVGHYKGVLFLDLINGKFYPAGSIPNFEESSRYLVSDKKGNLWVSHPYHGLYRINFKNGSFEKHLYTKAEGLPSALNNYVFLLKDTVYLATEKGVFEFDEMKNHFYPSSLFAPLIGTKSIRYLKEDSEGNCWFVQDKTVGVISSDHKSITYIPELTNKILSGFEFIFPVDANNIFISGERGVFHVNYEKYKENKSSLNVQIRKVSVFKSRDSIIYGGYGYLRKEAKNGSSPTIEYGWKSIRFNFAATLYGQQGRLEYSFRLKGFDNNWSGWSDRTEKEYTNLPEGTYTFEVKARNNFGSESTADVFAFHVLPPWHRTVWAYLLYTFLIIGGLISFSRWQQRKFQRQKEKIEEEKKRLLYIHELERNKNQSELIALKNENLEAEINFKNSELASSTMHLVKKGELLTKINEELTHVMRSLENPSAINEIKKVIKSVSDDDKIDQEWEAFAKHFDKVHSDFVVNLKAKHSNLTANEVKLCIYLRMNLTSKEIAQLINISVRGVEISRYRLRRKLNIKPDTSLFDHLIVIGSNKEDYKNSPLN